MTGTDHALFRNSGRPAIYRRTGMVAGMPGAVLQFQMQFQRLLSPFSFILLTGCEGVQSALAPGSPDAERYFMLSNIMFVAGGIIFILVMALAATAALRPDRLPSWLKGRSLILGAGLVFPVVALSLLLSYGLLLTRQGNAGQESDMPTVEITAHQFWWRIRYLTPAGEVDFETANELRLPVGRKMRLILTSADVIHSFWIPSLAGKTDLIPGRTTILHLSAGRAGIYRGQCAEFCGLQHANMSLYAMAAPEAEFSGWLAQQRTAASQVDGHSIFRTNGCGTCHTIRGTDATGNIGPDLTHFGSRRFIGAGMLPSNIGTIAGWIAGNQHIKPGNPMPAFDTIGGADLRALAGYLESLR